MVRAVAFDFGNTLVDTGRLLNWQSLYHDAITVVLNNIGFEACTDRIKQGEEILLKYNTRVHPREFEVKSDTIVKELFNKWEIENSSLTKNATETFASFFLAGSKPYPDSLSILRELKHRGLRIGVLTNVPYGLDKEYLVRGSEELTKYIDVFLDSTEVGFRKPNVRGYQVLAHLLEVDTCDCMFVGDEDVDIIGANSSGMISILVDRNNQNLKYGQAHTLIELNGILKFA